MNKKKLIELRCKAWGITEDEYYCNQCSDFSLEDMARAYRRGKNKGRADLEKENAELKKQVEQKQHLADVRLEQSLENYKLFSDERKARIDVDIAHDDTTDQLTYAKTIIQDLLDNTDEYARQRAEDFLKENKQLW